METVNVRNDLFPDNNTMCVGVNKFPTDDPQKNFINSIQNVQRTLSSLQRSLQKTNKYEEKLMRCKNVHSHSHDKHKWWGDDFEKKSFKNSNVNSSSSSSKKVVDKTECPSTMSIVSLQYQFQDLSKRYEALLQAYDDLCSEVSVRDIMVAQWRQRASETHAQLAQAHEALLAVGEKYLTLRRKRTTLKSQCDERVNRLKNMLHDVVEMTAREQLRFDAKLSHCMSSEHDSDAALLLSEIRKCNLLFIENMRLKTMFEELLPGHVNWQK